jgi:hypothetical protein
MNRHSQRSRGIARRGVYRIPLGRGAFPIGSPRTDVELAAMVASGRVDQYVMLTDEDRGRLVAALEGLVTRYPEVRGLLLVNEYDRAGRLAGITGDTLRNAVRALWPGWTPGPPDAATTTH